MVAPFAAAGVLARWDGKVVSAPGVVATVFIVPPLAEVIAEALRAHRRAQGFARAALRRRDGGRARCAFRVEAVEAGAHIERIVRPALGGRRGASSSVLWSWVPVGAGAPGSRIERNESEIDRNAGGMPRMRSDVAERKQLPLVGVRVEACVAVAFAVMRPAPHRGGRARRAVAVVHFQPEPLARERGFDALKRLRRLAFEHAFRCAIAGQSRAGKIRRTGIADVLRNRRRYVA